jgi:hypothetical protein
LIVEGTQAWTNEEAKELMVNKTSLAPRKVVVNAHNHNNPLQQWEDAIWYYKWVELDVDSSHCICLDFIPIKVADLVLHKPMDNLRDTINEDIHQMLSETIEMGKLNLTEDIPFLLAFIGLLEKDLVDLNLFPPKSKNKRKADLHQFQEMADPNLVWTKHLCKQHSTQIT